MRTTLGIGSAILVALAPAVVPAPAQAATGEFGNSCVATDPAQDATLIMTGKSVSNPLPIGAPFAGVITKVVITLPAEAGPGPYAAQVKTARPTDTAHDYQIVGQSASLDTGQGARSFDVRVPVAPGDLIGLSGFAAKCVTANAGDKTHVFNSANTPVGTTETYTETSSLAVPVVATVEPDADGDGYGDDTQDKCPQNAAAQICPPLKLDAFAVPAGKKISVLVATSETTKVAVSGTTKVGGKSVKLSAKPKSVAPGSLGKISLKLPAALKAVLAKLPPSKSIKVTITASAKGLDGTTRTDKTKVKLPGTG